MIHWALGLVLLLCGFPTACEGAAAALKTNSNEKTCEDKENDIRKGAGLSYCEGEAFNPEKATCCKAEDGNTQKVTCGLSEKVSACCGLKAYDKLNEICCQSTVIAKPGPKANCCGKDAYDEDTHLCCGEIDNWIVRKRNSSDHKCCGQTLFNEKTECCCRMNKPLKNEPLHSSCCVKQSALHGRKEQIDCSQPTAVAYPAANAICCGKDTYDENTHLCCGEIDNWIVRTRNSSNHKCCGRNQFDEKTECCCRMNEHPKNEPLYSSCCVKQSGASQQSPTTQPICTEPESSLCGSKCYNPKDFRCCERNQKNSPWCCAPGRCDDSPIVYNPHTHICCDGCVSQWIPWMDQCCGETAYGFAQRGVFCCNNTLLKDTEDGEECSGLGVPLNPAKGTCGSHFHSSHGIHCCGTEKYHPHKEICCDGHRHEKTENTHCCGGEAYDITDPLMKCCAGTLYNLTVGDEGKCCGSVLQTSQDVCCSSEDKEVLYMAKTAFECCGHHYYNTSLWSCCAGKPVHPVHQSPVRHPSKIKESILLSVNNVNDTRLCNKTHIGNVESVFRHSIVFSSVLIIHGRNAIVTPLASPYILQTRHHCTLPKLTLGKSYFFDDVGVFADFNHDSTLQSLHFILFRCYRP